MRLTAFAVLATGAIAAFATTASAQEPEPAHEPESAPATNPKAECAAAYELSQEKRKAGDLLGARKELDVCVRDVCPDFVRSECAGWREELENSMPTVVLAARLGDQDLTDVQVLLDGELLASELSAAGLPVNPGMRIFSFQRPGEPAIERKVLVRVGEKNRRIAVNFAGLTSAVAPAAEDSAASNERERAAKKLQQKRTISYVLAGTGAAALGAFVFFALSGKSAENELRDSCSPDCPKRDVDSIRTKYLLADISLGVSVVSLGAGAYLFFTSRPPAKQELQARRSQFRITAQPASGGAFVGVSSRF